MNIYFFVLICFVLFCLFILHVFYMQYICNARIRLIRKTFHVTWNLENAWVCIRAGMYTFSFFWKKGFCIQVLSCPSLLSLVQKVGLLPLIVLFVHIFIFFFFFLFLFSDVGQLLPESKSVP